MEENTKHLPCNISQGFYVSSVSIQSYPQEIRSLISGWNIHFREKYCVAQTRRHEHLGFDI